MNPRIMKKLCKRAKPHLERMGYESKGFFLSEGFDELAGVPGALQNTVGWGCMRGYEEPEWDEWPAYDLLLDHFMEAHTDWDNFNMDALDGPGWPEYIGPSKIFPSLVFRWAEMQEGKANG